MTAHHQLNSMDELREELITLVLEKVALEEQAEKDEDQAEVVKNTSQESELEGSSYVSSQSMR
jgi:hypothetical protein